VNLTTKTRADILNIRKNRINVLRKIYLKYKCNYGKLLNWLKLNGVVSELKNIFLMNFKEYFNKQFKNNLILSVNNNIQFSDSSMNKYITYSNLNKFNFFFLRKNRIFNKSRYSRNRQLYRTGFYWCL
jgi:hypothetical protein